MSQVFKVNADSRWKEWLYTNKTIIFVHSNSTDMKRVLLIFSNLFVALCLNAQVEMNIAVTSDKALYTGAGKGSLYKLGKVYYGEHTYVNGGQVKTYMIDAVSNDKEQTILAVSIPNDCGLKPVENTLNNYWMCQNFMSLRPISGIKDLYRKRADIESEANEYLSALERKGFVFDDPYLSSYLYSIVSMMSPTVRPDGFPYDVRIVVVRDDSMNACAFPNGTIIINTGLLANIHTEDELVSVIAHEMAHFVCNHCLVNIREMEKRAARAEFWAAFATAVAGAAEVYAASQGVYTYGATTVSTAVLATAIAQGVLERTGTEFSKEQEIDADIAALNVLQYLGYDKNATATVFQRMADAYNREGNWGAYYLSGDHPSLADRIKYSGTPYKRTDAKFEKIISFAVTDAAVAKYRLGRYRQALEYTEQNIRNGVATDDDYLIHALSTFNLYDDNEHNKSVLAMIQTAKELNPSNPNIIRTEICAQLRVNNTTKASSLIQEYKDYIRKCQDNNEETSSSYNKFLSNEYEWARKMAIKVKGL